MKRNKLYAIAVSSLICILMASCTNKEADDSMVAKATTAVAVNREDLEYESERLQTEIAVVTQAPETTMSEETTTTTTMATTAKPAETSPATTQAPAPESVVAMPAQTPVQTAAPVTTAPPVYTNIAETTTTIQIQSQTEIETEAVTHPPKIVFLPVSVTSEEPVAEVTGADEEPFWVYPDGEYRAVDMWDNYIHNELPNDYSFWISENKKVLNYSIDYEYYFDNDGCVHFEKFVVDAGEEQETVLNKQDFVLLCNCMTYEYADGRGSNYVPPYEKSLIVEVIMNRMKQSGGLSIRDIINESDMFRNKTRYIDATDYLPIVTTGDYKAVAMYFCNCNDPLYYHEGYTEFTTDGFWNYFK